MSAPLAGLGTVFQMAYCPRDFDAAIRYWTETMGVGPFFLRGPLQFPGTLYRGAPTDVSFSIAIAYWGETQIELTKVHNDAPSIYRDWHEAGLEGLHHICIEVADIHAARATCVARGLSIEQELYYPGGGAIYVDTGGGPGTLTEMVQLVPAQRERFAMFREAARGWDGRDPLREV